jgi:hypothetical protein
MQPGLTHVVTFPPGGGAISGRSLSHLGHVSPPVYSFTTPGGCDSLSLTLDKPPRVRAEALNTGRTVLAYRGGSIVWSGILDEPSPSDTGWTITAHGDGTTGADYRAIWTGTWGTGTPDNVVNAAIARGLNWVNPGIGSPSGMWMGQQIDSGSQTVTDLLNLVCSKGGLTWQVTTTGRGNVLSVFALPTTANRILIATAPEAQTIASGADAIYLRYQSSADGAAKAVYGLTSVVNQARIDAQGRIEDYTDLSSAGVQTAGSAQGVGNQVLKRFTRAGFTAPFTLRYGQLTNMGGVPVDPGCFYQDGASVMLCRALLSDFAFSGEVAKGPVTFLVGHYEWDDAARVATVTPFESMRHDFASLLSAAIDRLPVRAQPTHKKKKGR